MRAVVDTNVLVSAPIRPQGRLAWVIGRLADGTYTLVYSAALLDELVGVLSRPKFGARYDLRADNIKELRRLVTELGEVVAPVRRIAACRDPKDDRLLEVAVAARADAIVSGDRDLLVLHPFEGIPIVTPAAFLAMLSAEQPETQ